ncbi:MAG: VOC family protein [Methanobacteriaceae archaeon]
MIKKIDHFVITSKNPKKCAKFYIVLGFDLFEVGMRLELFAGDFKINIHKLGSELSPHTKNVAIGSIDFCFETDEELNVLEKRMGENGFESETGILTRNGVKGIMKSIYYRDFDGNLIEICKY